MPKINVLEGFQFSPNGFDVIDYPKGGQALDITEEGLQIALDNGWAEWAADESHDGAEVPGEPAAKALPAKEK